MRLTALLIILSTAFAWRCPAGEIVFTDATEASGLAKHLKAWQLGHAAAWGDVDGDGRPDLYVGAFADRPIFYTPDTPIPNMLFLQTPKGFVLSDERALRLEGKHARSTAAILVDLDNDGDLDLAVANHVNKPDACESVLFENLGGGRFRDATPTKGDWPRPFAARNAAALDVNADGLLDLILADGSYGNWRAGGGRLVVLQNNGDWTFTDVGAKLGFPPDGTPGLGLALGDANDDGAFDIFVADATRLFVSGPDGRYRECQAGQFARPPVDKEPKTCGAAFGDLDGDGLLDLVYTIHGQPTRIYVYLNKGITDGMPRFADVSEAAGVAAWFPSWTTNHFRIKTAHVALCDMDNDGRNDIVLTVLIKDERGQPQPLVLRNLGVKDGVPQFRLPPFDRVVTYYAPGPVADYDRDGRLDLFLPTWSEEAPSTLFRNVTEGGHWLEVRVAGKAPGLNPMGIGATVRAFRDGRLLARHDIAVGAGYASGEEALAHLGLGEATACDLEVTWGKRRARKANVAADQLLTITFGPEDGK